jgi:hypothetical protein
LSKVQSDCHFSFPVYVDRIILARQLAKVPGVGELPDQIMDSPDDADIYEAKLRDGDLIIAYVGYPRQVSLYAINPSFLRRMDYQTTSSIMKSPPFAVLSFGPADLRMSR